VKARILVWHLDLVLCKILKKVWKPARTRTALVHLKSCDHAFRLVERPFAVPVPSGFL
jgi:hypothetical protein